MNNPTNGLRRSLARAILSLLILAAFIQTASAEPALKVIDPPKGGKAMYGPVPGETTEAGAMGWILRSLHKEFGDKPQVSKLFQVRGTQSVAALFTLTNRNHGNVPWTGMVIAVKTATDNVEGGAVYDEASRFSASFNPMMKALFAAWHPFAAATAGAGKASALPPMQKFTARDNSASVDYPEGWKPSGNGGTLGISGPNGEFVSLDAALGGLDTRNRNVQNIMRTVERGGMPNSVYAKAYYCAWDTDLGKIFVDTMQRIRKQGNLPPADFQIESQTPMQGNSGRTQRCAHIIARVRPQGSTDDKNQRELNAVICQGPPSQMGQFSITLFYTTVPVALADKERPLLGAMLASFQINWAVVNREANAYAAPAIDAIHKIGEASAAQAKAQHEANDIHNSSVYAQWDAEDKRSAAFQNYQLGYSVVSDTGNTAHGTFWNEDADWLVKEHPNQFEYVNTPGYWKGVDY